MRYIDSGTRDESQALGTWLGSVLDDEARELRWQTGFFAGDSLGFLQPSLERFARENQPVHALIGSNDQCTIHDDVVTLANLLGVPRDRAMLGVVSYRNGYFHPKTFHVHRTDGSQTAYVGSANLTGSGITSLHVEAGLILDSRDGDSSEILSSISAAVDQWFDGTRAGMHRVTSIDDADQLLAAGVLSERPRPRPVTPREEGASQERTALSSLARLLTIPNLVRSPRIAPGPITAPGQQRRILLPAIPQPGLPPYILCAPGELSPTVGATALSGVTLPTGVSGLIIRLNRDSSRHFADRPGTANISLPVPTLTTFRFGRAGGLDSKPRAEFVLRTRYIGREFEVPGPDSETNIMPYGFMPGESGHGDVRMLIPRPPIRPITAALRANGRAIPQAGDAALLEWPTQNDERSFRLTFLEVGTPLSDLASSLLNDAVANGTTVGTGACWLPEALSPAWT